MTSQVQRQPRYSDKSKFTEFNLVNFNGVHKYKSVARAIRRGYVTPEGYVAPKRPFNNREDKSKSGHGFNTLRKQLYGELRKRAGF